MKKFLRAALDLGLFAILAFLLCLAPKVMQALADIFLHGRPS